MVIQPKLTPLWVVPQVSRWSKTELDESIDLAAAGASDTDVGNCGVGRESRYSSHVVSFAAAARLRWGQCARSCRYSRYHSNNVSLPSDDLTRGRK